MPDTNDVESSCFVCSHRRVCYHFMVTQEQPAEFVKPGLISDDDARAAFEEIYYTELAKRCDYFSLDPARIPPPPHRRFGK